MSPENKPKSFEVIDAFHESLQTMASEVGMPEGTISESGYDVAAKLLLDVHRQYGDPESDAYREHPNDRRALDVIHDSWLQWKPLREALPYVCDERGFELLMIAGTGHNIIYQDDAETGANELASAELVYGRMIIAGYEEDEARRVYDAIIKTMAECDPKTRSVWQTKMREGSMDPLGLVLVRAVSHHLMKLTKGQDKKE